MRATGNGAPQVCVNNLLRTFRGEVPFERVKGLDPRMIDRPILASDAQLRQDADWLVETYEPRAKVKTVTVEQSAAINGGFVITAEIEDRGD